MTNQTAIPYLSLSEAAEVIGVTRGRIYELICAGVLAWRWGENGQYLIVASSARQYAERRAPNRERTLARCRRWQSRRDLHKRSTT